MAVFVFFQYNEELHYVEPCLNGTLVQADVTNKDVSSFLPNLSLASMDGWMDIRGLTLSNPL